MANGSKDPATDQSADDSKNDVQEDAFALPVDDLARNKARNQSQNDPR
jgi:hypothetical protein